MNITQHETRLNEHEERLKKIERFLEGSTSTRSSGSSSLEEAIRKAKQSATK
jgi:hypothetical protein